MNEVLDPLLAPGAPAAPRWRKPVLVALKVAVTFGCFALVARQLDGETVARIVAATQPGWLLLATLCIAVEIPLVGERWRLIVRSLGRGLYDPPAASIHGTNGLGLFLGQVLPTWAGDGARALMLRNYGVTLAHATWSVLLDRAVGVFVLFVIALGALLLPSGLEALGGYREPILLAVTALVAGGAAALALARPVGAWIGRRPRLRFLGLALMETHHALLGRRSVWVFAISALIHGLTILCAFWLARAIGLPLPLTDAAVLVVCISVVTMIPFSFGGWGVREVAVTALLTSHGASAEEAVVFSVAFGLVVMIATIPGALFWAMSRGRPVPR